MVYKYNRAGLYRQGGLFADLSFFGGLLPFFIRQGGTEEQDDFYVFKLTFFC